MRKAARLVCCIFAMSVLAPLSVCYGQDVSGMTGKLRLTLDLALADKGGGCATPFQRYPRDRKPFKGTL
jgi:hypothetical protein